VEKNRRQGLGLKVAGAAAGVSEQRRSVVELADAVAVPDGDWGELSSGTQQQLQVAPNFCLRRRSVLGAEDRLGVGDGVLIRCSELQW
jgi:hypothetical protein